jgi:foldase protein PrsA
MSCRRALPSLIAACSLVGLAPAWAEAQEEPLPNGVVARVGEESITEREFRKWLRTAALGQDRRNGVPDPPRFKRCVAVEQRRQAKERRRLSRGALRRRCRRRYRQLRSEVMQFLVQAVWVRQEATARGIAVTPRQVRRSFERQKRQAFKTERAYRRFLHQSGMSEADILFRVRLDLLQTRLTELVAASAQPVTGDEVDAYYAKHRRRYRGIPRRKARREIRRLLRAEHQQRELDRFIQDYRARYKAITVCADGYVVAECSNAPPE